MLEKNKLFDCLDKLDVISYDNKIYDMFVLFNLIISSKNSLIECDVENPEDDYDNEDLNSFYNINYQFLLY